jgi:hypothetical protein
LNESLEAVLKRTNDRDTLHRWIDEQPDNAKILILAMFPKETSDAYRYCCSEDLMVQESNWMIDVYKRYLMDSTER